MAVRSRDSEEQRALMDAVSIVRQHRAEIELRFRRSFTDVFERRMFNQRTASAPEAVESGELSLVDDAEIQAKLAVDRLVHRTRGALDPDEVLGMRARLAALLERDWFDEAQHPAAPEAVDVEALAARLDVPGDALVGQGVGGWEAVDVVGVAGEGAQVLGELVGALGVGSEEDDGRLEVALEGGGQHGPRRLQGRDTHQAGRRGIEGAQALHQGAIALGGANIVGETE